MVNPNADATYSRTTDTRSVLAVSTLLASNRIDSRLSPVTMMVSSP